MNKVILMGRLTRDAELSQTPSGVAMARFTLAVDRRYLKDGQRQTDFISCIAWRQQAEFICRFFRKGSMLGIVGNIQTRSWDGQDGKKQYATDVVVDEAYFTGSKAETGTSNTAGAGYGGYTQPAQKPAQAPSAAEPDFNEFDDGGFSVMDGGEDMPFDDDLPF